MLKIHAIPAFNDNYIWAITNSDTKECWVVDPGTAQPVHSFLAQHQFKLKGILLTHHHQDHQGGVAELATAGVEVLGNRADAERLHGLTKLVEDNQQLEILSQQVQVIEVSGHTLGHLAFYFPNLSTPVVFTGDTLFAAGCGRRFEGSAAQMQTSLAKLAQLPSNTKIYAAHEYTLSNLKFAQLVEPNNPAITKRLQSCQALRNNHQPTLPSTLAVELESNPFLRLHAPEVQASLRQRHPEADLTNSVIAFDLLRQWKDQA